MRLTREMFLKNFIIVGGVARHRQGWGLNPVEGPLRLTILSATPHTFLESQYYPALGNPYEFSGRRVSQKAKPPTREGCEPCSSLRMAPAYGWCPFLGTLNIRCCIRIGIQKGTIILTNAHMSTLDWYFMVSQWFWGYSGRDGRCR